MNGCSPSEASNEMAAAAAEGAKLTEQVGLSCPEFGRSMTPPKFEPPMKRSSIVAHVILAILGTVMFAGVGVWFALFSRDREIHRMVGSALAFCCSILFISLGYLAMRKRRQKKEVEIHIDPESLREQRRSMSHSMRHTLPLTGNELMSEIRRHSACITVENYEKALRGDHGHGHAAVVRTLSPKLQTSVTLSVPSAATSGSSTNCEKEKLLTASASQSTKKSDEKEIKIGVRKAS